VSEGGSIGDRVGTRVTALRAWADDLQQRHGVLGFPYAVIKKYGDDQGSRYAALLTYYGFLSVFPLLLLATVALSAVLAGDDELREELIDAIVPEDLQSTVDNAVQNLPSGGVAFWIAVFGLLFAGLGIVYTVYDTLNHLAGVPHRRRLEFFPRYLRIVAMFILLVLGVIGIGAMTVAVGALPDLPVLTRAAAFAGTTALVFCLFWAAPALLLPRGARVAAVWPAALLGALTVTALLTFGAVVLPQFIARAGPVYGSFATIAGVFALLYLVNQAIIYSAEIALVRRRRLWPRGLDLTKPTAADVRALTLVARAQERTVVERISARFDADPTDPDS
jgi:uncharacterized BrkB/YihY/UPF0761 family membrane protein